MMMILCTQWFGRVSRVRVCPRCTDTSRHTFIVRRTIVIIVSSLKHRRMVFQPKYSGKNIVRIPKPEQSTNRCTENQNIMIREVNKNYLRNSETSCVHLGNPAF